MAVIWEKVPDEIVQLAEELIAEFHPDLEDASVGLLFRGKAPVSNGKATWGKASKFDAKYNALLDEESELDFLIWLAKDVWETLEEEEQRALLDHELTHLYIEEDKAKTRKHDVEEFASIIDRYGLWNLDLERVEPSFRQHALPSMDRNERKQRVVAVQPQV